MNELNSLKHSMVEFFTIIILFSFSEPLRCEQQSVQIGKWTNSSSSFSMNDSPRWGGSFRYGNDSIMVIIYENQNEYKAEEISTAKEINIRGVKKALFNVVQSYYTRQQVESPLEKDMVHYLVCTYGNQLFVFRRSVNYKRESGTMETMPQFIIECNQKGLHNASNDPLVLFATLFFKTEIELGQNCANNTYPIIEASIDNGEYIELKNSKSRKEDRYGWNLPAKPGQNVKFRMKLDTYEITATTYGITTKFGREFSQGRKISIEGKQSIFNSSGIAELDYGNLEGQELLILRYRGWKDSSSQFNGNICLRWGRPEEEWLDTNNFPLAEQITNPTIDNCIGNLLHDLNIAYDWDRNCWITYRGEQRTGYNPDYTDFKVLDESDLSDFTMLQEIVRRLGNGFEKIELDEIKEVQKKIIDGSLGSILWEQMTSMNGNGPRGWHSPSKVLSLSYLYKEFPELRKNNPIERTLDFWVESMKENPDPVGPYGKGGVSYTDDLNSRAYAIAALDLGYEIFRKPEYKVACDDQVKRFRDSLQEKGFLDSIINLEGLKDEHFGFTPEIGRQMCEAVSLYGQVCALIGDEEGLKQSKNWIKAALIREGKNRENPFSNYEAATFKDRCGFIAILRGKSIFSELPLKRDVLLN